MKEARLTVQQGETRAGEPMIDVLMAAFNGEDYVAEQIESIVRQDFSGWRLVVRDDHSTDSTLAVVQECALRYPDRIVVQERDENSGSAKQNFLEMLGGSTAPYVMFADDDDIWRPDKISRTLGAMQQLERRLGTGTPLLVHTDLTVVGQNLEVIARSMSRSQQLDGNEARLSRTVVQNVVTGCTVMVNRALADLVHEPFDGIVMHDWWLATIASAFGAISFVDSSTVLYRQHGKNVVGARPTRSLSYNVGRYLDRKGTEKMLADSYTQAEVFLERFADRLSEPHRELLRAYTAIPTLGKVGRVRELQRHGFWKSTTVRRLGQVLFV